MKKVNCKSRNKNNIIEIDKMPIIQALQEQVQAQQEQVQALQEQVQALQEQVQALQEQVQTVQKTPQEHGSLVVHLRAQMTRNKTLAYSIITGFVTLICFLISVAF